MKEGIILFSATLGILDSEIIMEISVQESPFISKGI